MSKTRQPWTTIVDEASLAAALNLCEIWLRIDAATAFDAPDEMLAKLINEIEAYEAIHHCLPTQESP